MDSSEVLYRGSSENREHATKSPTEDHDSGNQVDKATSCDIIPDREQPQQGGIDIPENESDPHIADVKRLVERNTRIVRISKTGLQFRYAKRDATNTRPKDPASDITFNPAVSTQAVEEGWTDVRDVSDDWAMVNDKDPEEEVEQMTRSTGNIMAHRKQVSSSSSSTTEATIALPPIDLPQNVEPWWIKAGVSWRPFGYKVFDVNAQSAGYNVSQTGNGGKEKIGKVASLDGKDN